LHVALKIAPVYDAPVIWTKDASQPPIIAARLMDPKQRKNYEDELATRYEQLRQQYQEKQAKLMSLDQARDNKLNLFDD
jgi:5-methyltetrahydrofolate--homocysteine methyltransferase